MMRQSTFYILGYFGIILPFFSINTTAIALDIGRVCGIHFELKDKLKAIIPGYFFNLIAAFIFYSVRYLSFSTFLIVTVAIVPLMWLNFTFFSKWVKFTYIGNQRIQRYSLSFLAVMLIGLFSVLLNLFVTVFDIIN